MPNRIGQYRHPNIGHQARQVDHRPSAARRHYDRHWQRKRLAHLKKEPLCRHCKARGKLVPATDVDHIIPLPEGLDDESNYQSLCHACHSTKTRSENP